VTIIKYNLEAPNLGAELLPSPATTWVTINRVNSVTIVVNWYS